MAWAVAHAPLSTPDVFRYRDFEYRMARDIAGGHPGLVSDDGHEESWYFEPGYGTIWSLYEELMGEPPGDFWGTPARDRYKRALIGGDVYVEFERTCDISPARWSTAAEAAEAAETVREISERGGPNATRAELGRWDYEIQRYAHFFEQYRPGEELFYLKY